MRRLAKRCNTQRQIDPRSDSHTPRKFEAPGSVGIAGAIRSVVLARQFSNSSPTPLNRALQTARQHLKAMGVGLRGCQATAEEQPGAIRLYAQGLSLESVAG